jgi:hypothetical protein
VPLLTLAIDGIPLMNALLFKKRLHSLNDGFKSESGIQSMTDLITSLNDH